MLKKLSVSSSYQLTSYTCMVFLLFPKHRCVTRKSFVLKLEEKKQVASSEAYHFYLSKSGNGSSATK